MQALRHACQCARASLVQSALPASGLHQAGSSAMAGMAQSLHESDQCAAASWGVAARVLTETMPRPQKPSTQRGVCTAPQASRPQMYMCCTAA